MKNDINSSSELQHKLSKIDCGCSICFASQGDPDKCPAQSIAPSLSDWSSARYTQDPFTLSTAQAHSRLLGRGSSQWPRLEHIREFCVQAGIKKAGLAICSMFLDEAKAVSKYLQDKNINTATACCKLGALKLKDIGGDERYTPCLCNPVAQAAVLDAHKVEMIVLMGLCAPHDMLLAWHAKAPCTTLFAKEHVSGHAPYQSLPNNKNG